MTRSARWYASPSSRVALAALPSLLMGAEVLAQEVHEAAAEGDTAAVAALLVDHPELLGARDARGRTPLMVAAASRRGDVVRLLLREGADKDAVNDRTGLRAADYAFLAEAQGGGADVTGVLIAAGAEFDPSGTVRGSVRRLDVAVVFGNLEMVELLLQVGADPNATTGYPMKPLASAAARGYTDVVETLLASGADPNGVDAGGDPPLRRAVDRGHARVVDVLLEAGATPSFVEESTGRSLLHLAALGGHLPIVQRLLDAGADPRLRDASGKGALFYARRYGHRAVSLRLSEAGAPPERDLPEPSATLLHRPLREGGAVLWYLANRGWAVRTENRLLVFDAEEHGIRRPTEPSLSNGFLTPSEVGEMDVVVFFTAYHGEVGEPAYVHRIEDSLRTVTYVQNAGDRWRGSDRSVYLTPHADTSVAGVRIRTVEVTREMPSLGYLVEVDGLVLYYAGFRAEDSDAFAREVDTLSRWTKKVDVAFLPIPEPGEDAPEVRLLLERLRPLYVALLDPDRREELFPGVVADMETWGLGTRFFAAELAGDAFLLPAGGSGG